MKIGWKLDEQTLAITLLTIADASSFWSANNPSFFTVRHFTTEGDQKADDTRTDIYIGSLKATLETIAVGFGGALITKSWWPVAGPMIYIALDWAFYKWALDNPHSSAVPIAQQDLHFNQPQAATYGGY